MLICGDENSVSRGPRGLKMVKMSSGGIKTIALIELRSSVRSDSSPILRIIWTHIGQKLFPKIPKISLQKHEEKIKNKKVLTPPRSKTFSKNSQNFLTKTFFFTESFEISEKSPSFHRKFTCQHPCSYRNQCSNFSARICILHSSQLLRVEISHRSHYL